MLPAEIPVTFFADFAARAMREERLDPRELAHRIETMIAAEKGRLPWLKLGRFGSVRTEKGSLRHDGNMTAISGIEADYDGEQVDFDIAVETVEKAGLAAIVYTSPSHTPEAPRWRLLAPTSCELDPQQRAQLVARLNGLFRGIFAIESFTLSQAYYYGQVASNAARAHRVEVVDGTPIDLLDELDQIAIGKPNGSAGQHSTTGGPLDEDALAAEIVSGAGYHVACTRLVGKWAQAGVPFLDAQRRLEALFDAVFPPDRDQRWHQRRADVPRIVRDIYGKDARREDAAAQSARDSDTAPALWIDDEAWIEADLPRRRWVAAGYALRGAVTVITGPPSAMKSSLMLGWACAAALHRPHAKFTPIEPGVVIVYNVEDDQTEQRRRLSAVLRQFDATPTDIAGKVIRTGPSGIGTLFERDERGAISPTAAMSRLRILIETRHPDLLIADPLAELHNSEENDNTALRSVIAAFRAIAVEFDIAVILIHHTRKGELVPGDPDSARGASAIIGAARIVKTLIGMSEQDAKAFGVPEDRQSRSSYVRLDDAKQNYAGIGDAEWYEKTLYRLDNGEPVAAAVPWAAPDMWQAITPGTANVILDDVDAGMEDGKRRYTDHNAAEDRAGWPIVQRHVPSLTEQQCRAVIKSWLENGVLYRKPYDDPIDRKKRSGLFVAKRPGAIG